MSLLITTLLQMLSFFLFYYILFSCLPSTNTFQYAFFSSSNFKQRNTANALEWDAWWSARENWGILWLTEYSLMVLITWFYLLPLCLLTNWLNEWFIMNFRRTFLNMFRMLCLECARVMMVLQKWWQMRVLCSICADWGSPFVVRLRIACVLLVNW